MSQTITAWSNSRADTYLLCPFRAKLKFKDKRPELPRELPTGKKEHANDRGSRIHDAAERMVTHSAPMVRELHHFETELVRAQDIYVGDSNSIETEKTWFFDADWLPIDGKEYDKIWLRVVIDLNVRLSPTEVLIIDHKSGKRYNNEVKHSEQMLLYVLSTFMKYPEVELVTAELWYLDLNELVSITMTRHQALQLFRKFNNLGVRITSDTTYIAKPSLHSCRFCPYRSGANKWVVGTGECKRNPADKTEQPDARWHTLRNEGLLKLKELQEKRRVEKSKSQNKQRR